MEERQESLSAMLELCKKDLEGPRNVLVIGGEKLASSEMLNAFVGKWSGWVYSEIDSRKLFPLTLSRHRKAGPFVGHES
jgi:hypothetical protein